MTIDIDDAINALLAYRQADMEGVEVLTSRQAIHEVTDELRRLRALAQSVSEPVGKYEIASAVHEGRYSHDYPPELVKGFDEEHSPGREYCFRIATSIMDKFDVVRKGAPVQSCSAGTAEVPTDALINLVNYQEQCDEDGVMVKVSRQALAEVLLYVQLVRPDLNGGPQTAPEHIVANDYLSEYDALVKANQAISLANKIDLHLTLSGASPGFHLSEDELQMAAAALRFAAVSSVSRPHHSTGEA